MANGRQQAGPRRKGRQRGGWVLLLIVTALLIGASRSLWAPLIGGFLIVTDPLPDADALVVLAGEPQRVIYGTQLFHQGHAHWFVATNMRINDPSIRYRFADLVTSQAIERGVPENRILSAPGTASTTYEEALNVRQLALHHAWRSLIVVTSPSHSRRSRLIFRDVLRNTGITVSVRPIEGHWYTAQSWWTTEDGQRETWLEYVKIGLYAVGHR